MTDKSKDMWLINGLLAVILLLLGSFYIRSGTPNAHAAGGGGGDAVMAMTTSGPADHLVLVDTTAQNIMVYICRGKGQFGLVGARSYKYDVEMEDTSYTPEITQVGVTFKRAYEMYQNAQRTAKKTP